MPNKTDSDKDRPREDVQSEDDQISRRQGDTEYKV